MDFSIFASEPVGQPDWPIAVVDPPNSRSLAWLKTQARFGVPVWAVCLNCDHTRLLDAADLIAATKPNIGALSAIEDQMHCRVCGSWAGELRAATPIPEYLA